MLVLPHQGEAILDREAETVFFLPGYENEIADI